MQTILKKIKKPPHLEAKLPSGVVGSKIRGLKNKMSKITEKLKKKSELKKAPSLSKKILSQSACSPRTKKARTVLAPLTPTYPVFRNPRNLWQGRSLPLGEVGRGVGRLLKSDFNIRKMINPKMAREAIAVMLMVGMVAGPSIGIFGNPGTAQAATFTSTWTSQGDFESNTAGNGGSISTTTSATRLDTATTPGTVLMGPGTVQATSTSFTDSYQIDLANSTAIASGNQLQKTNVDTFTDLTSSISGFWGTLPILNMTYMSSNDALYFAGSLNKSSTIYFGKYSASDSRNLSSKLSSVGFNAYGSDLSAIQIAALQSSGDIYLSDNNGGCGPVFYKHSIANDTNGTNATNLSSKLNGLGAGGCYVGAQGLIAINNSTIGVGYSGNTVYEYSPADDSVTTRSTSSTGSTEGSANHDIIYASTANAIINVGIATVGKYTYGSGTSLTTSTAGVATYGGMGYGTIDESTGALGTLYFGGTTYNPGYFGTFGKYDISTNAVTNLSSYISSTIGVVTGAPGANGNLMSSTNASNASAPGITSMASFSSDAIYIGGMSDNGASVSLIKFNPSTNAIDVNLTSSLPSGFGTSTAMVVGNGVVYVGSSNGKLVKITAPPATQTAQSNTIDTIDGNIAYATLTKNDTVGTGTVTYELSNDGGSTWVTATPGSQTNFATVGSNLKYKITLTGNATVQDIAIAYNGYSTAILGNIKKDAGGDAIMTSLAWNVSMPANTVVSFRTRGATQAEGAAALYSASWSDYTVSATGAGSATIKTNGNGATNPTYRYFEIEATLTSSNGVATASISDFTLTYVINGPPNFDTTYGGAGTGATTTVSTTEGSNWGKVVTSYSVRDADGSSGSATPYAVTPSFEYSLNGGSSWAAVNSSYLGASDVSNKTVAESVYNTYSATWNAVGQLGANTYTANAKIRVTINDNEPVNNTATALSAAFTLDTKKPVTGTFLLDAGSATTRLSITVTDDSQIQDYQISNNTDMTSDGNGLSGSWQTATSTTFSVTRDWTLTSSSTVTAVLRDIYGNVATSTAVAPATPTLMDLKDISSPSSDTYREFLAWSLYPSSASGATFQRYELVRSSDGGSTYGSPNSITDRTINYYTDTTVASTTTYYYKVRVVDSDGDISAYGSVVNDQPNGQGGTDTTQPTITSVVSDTVKNTSARIGWDTDEIATSRVEYGTVAGTYGSSAVSSAYVVTGHEVYITGLTPNTTYYYRVKSTDVSTNIGTNDNSGAGYSFTTAGGPVISNVTVTSIADSEATIFWNTTTPSTSYVDWSTSNTLASYTESGSASLATSTNPVQHQVTLTGLIAGTTYYYQVKSTDADSNTSIDTNNGSYFSFVTTYDTKAPTISSVSSPVQASNSAVIVWTTDELATTQVEYGTTASTTDGGYSATTVVVSTPSIFHVSTLSPETSKTGGGTNTLGSEVTYYYRVISNDIAGNRAYSSEYSLLTTKDGAVVVSISGGGGGATPVQADTSAPVITNVKVEKITPFGATVTFVTDEDATDLLFYGETTNYGSNTGSVNWTTTHSIALKNLQMNTTYHVKASATDKSGNTGYSLDYTFKTNSLAEDLGNLQVLNTTPEELQNKIDDLIESVLPSLNPPFIEKPEVVDVTEDGATITWKTNVKAFGSVSYASDSEYSKSNGAEYVGKTSETSGSKTVNHEVLLTNLNPNTKYHFMVKSYVFPQVEGSSKDMTFVTKSARVTAQIFDVKTDSFRAVWTTEQPTTSIVEYKNTRTGEVNRKIAKDLISSHDIKIENLTPGAVYEVKVSGYTIDDNLVEAKEPFTVKMSTDISSPEISQFNIDSTITPGRNDRTQVTVSWKTSEPASSLVGYEEGSGSDEVALANKIEENGYTTSHTVVISGLKPGTIYRISVTSVDEAGNSTKFPMRTVITARPSESVIDVIFKNFEDTFKVFQKIR